MTKEQNEKLKDYLDGFLSLGETGIYPIGVILAEIDEHKKVLNFLKDKNVLVFDNKAASLLENSLEHIFHAIEQGQVFAVHSELELSPKLYNLFLDFTHGQISINSAGKDTKVINPVPPGAKTLFILEKSLFDKSEKFGRIVSSICGI